MNGEELCYETNVSNNVTPMKEKSVFYQTCENRFKRPKVDDNSRNFVNPTVNNTADDSLQVQATSAGNQNNRKSIPMKRSIFIKYQQI